MAISTQEIKTILAANEWELIGKGSFNTVYRSKKPMTIKGYTGLWVVKHQDKPHYLSESIRAVRLWNKVNPGFPAFVLEQRWIAPYLGNTQATDQEIATKTIEIYRSMRMIIADGCSPGNFLVHNGMTVCIDFDMAFTRGSLVSNHHKFYDKKHIEYLDKVKYMGFPLTTEIIHSLGYLERQVPASMIPNEFITESLLLKLKSFRIRNANITPENLELLMMIERIDPEGKIQNKYITPAIIQQVQKKIDQRETVDINVLETLVYEGLVSRGIEGIVKRRDIDDFRLLRKYNSPMLTTVDNKGYLPIHYVALYGNAAQVNYLFEQGYDLNVPTADESNNTALELAVFDLRKDSGKALLARGALGPGLHADIEKISYFFLFLLRAGLAEQVQNLIEFPPSILAQFNESNKSLLLGTAVVYGDESIVKFIIQLGVNLHEKIMISEDCPDVDKLQFEGFNALDFAITMGKIQMAAYLQGLGVSPNVNHSTVLNKSVEELIKFDQLDYLRLLFQYNANLLNAQDDKGYTPLHYAVSYNKYAIAVYLLEAGADPGIKGNRPSPWCMAIANERVRMTRLMEARCVALPMKFSRSQALVFAVTHGFLKLLERLCDEAPSAIQVKLTNNQSLLHIASARGLDDVVTFLINRKINLNDLINIKSNDYLISKAEHGYSPLDMAIKYDHQSTIAILVEAGAQVKQLSLSSCSVPGPSASSTFNFAGCKF